jgi:uncharacterized repeat protein (TIGR01451 family)
MGPNGNGDYDAEDPAAAYRSATGEFLAVWEGDDNTSPLVVDEKEIFGQRYGPALADLELDKDDGGASVTQGGTITYTLTYTNTATAGAVDVVITDTVPSGTTFNVGASSGGWVCAPGVSAGSTCTRSVGVVAGGGGGSLVLGLTVDDPFGAGTEVSNSASIGCDGGDANLANNDAGDTTPVVGVDLALDKDDGDATVIQGGVVTYTLTYTNVGDAGATGVVVTETVPAGTAFNAGASSGDWVCAPDGGAGSTCTRAVGAVGGGGGGGSLLFGLTVNDPFGAGTEVSNSASIGDDGASGSDLNPANNSAGDTTPVVGVDLVLIKDDVGGGVPPGGVVTYTLTYANLGTAAAAGVVITETVPAGTAFNAGESSVGWVCAPGVSAGSTCTRAVGAVGGGGGSGALVFGLTVDDPFGAGSEVSNSASIGDDGASGSDLNPADNTTADTTPVLGVDLVLDKDDGGATTEPGGSVKYALTITNTGGAGATGVVITETVPAGTSFSAAGSTGGWVCTPDGSAGNTCTWYVGAVAGSGGNATVDFALNVGDPFPGSLVTNDATVGDDGASGGDLNPADNDDGDTTPVIQADVAITKTASVSAVGDDDVFSYTLTVTNNGPSAATGVVVTDDLPGEITWLNDDCGAGPPAGSTLTWSVGGLEALGSDACHVEVQAGSGSLPDVITNTASVAAATHDPGAGDNSAAVGTGTIVDVFLPLALRGYVAAPDLVIDGFLVSSTAVTVTIRNAGTRSVVDEFWVDVYVDPAVAPTGPDQLWFHLGDEGLAWGVTASALPLEPGEAITLTVGDAYYDGGSSSVTWPLAPGRAVYVQADSWGDGSGYGAVAEDHEIRGDTVYNNIAGTLSIAGISIDGRYWVVGVVGLVGVVCVPALVFSIPSSESRQERRRLDGHAEGTKEI